MVQLLSLSGLLIIIQISGLVLAAPSHHQGPSDEEEAAMLVIISCWAENWGDEAKQESCRSCFFSADTDTESGLTSLKQCMTNYLPMEAETCSSEMSQLTLANRGTQLEVLADCMGDKLKMMGLEFCVSMAGSGGVVDQLTNASMCMIHSHFEGIKEIKKISGDKLIGEGPGENAKMKMMELMLKAHCDHATGSDAAKTAACTECFTGVHESAQGNIEQIVSGSVTCSNNHLGDQYSQCAALLQAQKHEESHKCYSGVLLREIVDNCTDDSSVVDVATLESVMSCGKKTIMSWIAKNARPGLVKRIAAMMGLDEEMDE